jgi:glycosyltransferase involved in cell wall biosynthesis
MAPPDHVMSSATINVLELRSVRGTGGGPEKTILIGAAAADPGRCRITICYIRDARDTVFGLDRWARQLDVDYVEVVERHSFDPRAWREVIRLARERDIDIIHSHDYKTNVIALAAGWSTGATPLSTAHGWTGRSRQEQWVYYPADKRVLARFPRVIAVSNEIRQELVRRGAPADRVTVLLNGIDSSAFRRRLPRRGPVRAACGLREDDVVIGAVGRLEVQKRFDLLLRVAASLTTCLPTLKLVVVGDGSQRTTLQTVARSLGISDRCRWLGHRTDIADLHHAFDVFVQSSDYEGTPNAVLEAMAMETPVVATDAGGTCELLDAERHALIVPPADEHSLASAIQRTLADPEGARTRTRAARNRVERDLSFAVRTRRLEGIYEELLAARRAGRVPTPVSSGARRA